MRSSGILMPVFSLPSPYGIGTLGKEAYMFVDFLRKAGQRYWQILPLNPTNYGDSPYQSFSAFAGNPYFIDLDELAADGLAVFPVTKEDLYVKGGLNQIVAHLITVVEQLTNRDMSEQKRILRLKRLADARWHMALSLLPGKHERNTQVGRFIYGHEVLQGPVEVHECWVEL